MLSVCVCVRNECVTRMCVCVCMSLYVRAQVCMCVYVRVCGEPSLGLRFEEPGPVREEFLLFT